MRMRRIPGTDLEASVLCLGTASFGSRIGQEESFRLMDRFVDRGGNFLDTARIYADWLPGERSASEKTIGRWLADRGMRGRVIVATKGGHPVPSHDRTPRLAPEQLREDVLASLHNLQIERLDLYWLHRDDEIRPVADIVDTLEELSSEGLIRWYGCSNWRPARIAAALSYAKSRGAAGFVANQPGWSLARSGVKEDPTLVAMDEEAVALHQRTGMAVVPYSSQAKGLFGGKTEPSALLQPDALPGKLRSYAGPRNAALLDRVQRLAAELGVSGNQVALAYLLNQPFPVYPVIGCRTVEQVTDSCGASGVQLPAEALAGLDRERWGTD